MQYLTLFFKKETKATKETRENRDQRATLELRERKVQRETLGLKAHKDRQESHRLVFRQVPLLERYLLHRVELE